LKVGVWGLFGKVGKGVVEEWLLRLVAWLIGLDCCVDDEKEN
jgi:hypothetical protein